MAGGRCLPMVQVFYSLLVVPYPNCVKPVWLPFRIHYGNGFMGKTLPYHCTHPRNPGIAQMQDTGWNMWSIQPPGPNGLTFAGVATFLLFFTLIAKFVTVVPVTGLEDLAPASSPRTPMIKQKMFKLFNLLKRYCMKNNCKNKLQNIPVTGTITFTCRF